MAEKPYDGRGHGAGAPDALEALFDEARASAPEPSHDLTARVLADALAAMPVARPAERPDAVARCGFLGGLLAALGGWGGIGGLATAAVAGVWIGFSSSVADSTVAGLLGSGDMVGTVELLPGADAFADVGEVAEG